MIAPGRQQTLPIWTCGGDCRGSLEPRGRHYRARQGIRSL